MLVCGVSKTKRHAMAVRLKIFFRDREQRIVNVLGVCRMRFVKLEEEADRNCLSALW